MHVYAQCVHESPLFTPLNHNLNGHVATQLCGTLKFCAISLPSGTECLLVYSGEGWKQCLLERFAYGVLLSPSLRVSDPTNVSSAPRRNTLPHLKAVPTVAGGGQSIYANPQGTQVLLFPCCHVMPHWAGATQPACSWVKADAVRRVKHSCVPASLRRHRFGRFDCRRKFPG